MLFRGKAPYWIAASFWEEHCVECGAPACYATCEKYERGPSGRCRLFKGGLRHRWNGDVAIQFKEWGKLELRFPGYMVSSRIAWWLRLFGLEYWGEDFRYHVITRLSKTGISPETWRMGFRVDQSVDLIAAIVEDGKGDLFSQRITVGPGHYRFEFKVPKCKGNMHFRMSAINGTQCPVVFTEMVLGAPKRKLEPAKFVKCVAWDLDNTLWDGILANDGEDGVKLRPDVVDVIKELDRRGILNTICSKNDFELAWEKLKALELAEYFVFPQISWKPKALALKQISADINIGLDTIAFVDDSPHERGSVADHLPMVRVFKETEAAALWEMPCFNPPVSSESAKRRLSYLAEMTRRKSAQTFAGDTDAFLRSCEIVLELEKPDVPEVIRRCWELVNRTNQLTLAAHRYTEDEFKTMLSENETYAIRCHDKYGDYGIVGFIAIHSQNHVTEFREFVMSCRVAMKKCEFATVDFIAARVAACGDTALFADVVKTGRNQALISAFDAMPNIVKGSTRQGFRYSLSFDGCVRPKTPVKVCLSNKSTC